MEAEYIDRETLVSLIARWSTGLGGTGGGSGVTARWGVEDPEREEKIEEKKPPPEVGGLLAVVMVLSGFIRFFSVPEV